MVSVLKNLKEKEEKDKEENMWKHKPQCHRSVGGEVHESPQVRGEVHESPPVRREVHEIPPVRWEFCEIPPV